MPTLIPNPSLTFIRSDDELKVELVCRVWKDDLHRRWEVEFREIWGRRGRGKEKRLAKSETLSFRLLARCGREGGKEWTERKIRKEGVGAPTLLDTNLSGRGLWLLLCRRILVLLHRPDLGVDGRCDRGRVRV